MFQISSAIAAVRSMFGSRSASVLGVDGAELGNLDSIREDLEVRIAWFNRWRQVYYSRESALRFFLEKTMFGRYWVQYDDNESHYVRCVSREEVADLVVRMINAMDAWPKWNEYGDRFVYSLDVHTDIASVKVRLEGCEISAYAWSGANRYADCRTRDPKVIKAYLVGVLPDASDLLRLH